MKLSQRIRNLFTASVPVEFEHDKNVVLNTNTTAPTYLIRDAPRKFTRAEDIKIAQSMYENDPRIKKALRNYSRDIARAGFEIRCLRSPKAQTVLDDLYKLTKINLKLSEWVKYTLRDGDSFLAIYPDAKTGVIEKILRLPTLKVTINDKGQFEYRSQTSYFGSAPDLIFEPWQIIHAKWDSSDESLYGVSILTAAQTAYAHAKEGEEDLYVKRLTTASTRYSHTLEGASQSEIDEYRERNKEILNNPSVKSIAEFYSNKKGSIDVVEAAAPNGQIGDIQHHIETMLTALDVPAALIGYASTLSRDVLQSQIEQYNLSTEFDTETWVTDQFINPLIERALLLQGILPENVSYEILWRYRTVPSPETMKLAADSIVSLRTSGFTNEAIAKWVVRYFPNMTYLELLSNMKNEVIPQTAPGKVVGG